MAAWMLPAAIFGSSLVGAAAGNRGTTSTSTTQLPDYLRPYGPQYAQRVAALADSPYQAYGGNRVAGFGGDQLSAMDMARQQAMQSSPLFGQAQDQFSRTIAGDYLDPASNPWLQKTFDFAANRMGDAYAKGTGASTNAMMGHSGVFGGSAHEDIKKDNELGFGLSLGNLATNIFGGNYQAERARQQQATQAMPQFAAGQQNYGLTNANALLGIGQMQQGQDQRMLDDAYGRFAEAREHPYRQLDVYASMFNPNLGNTEQQTQPGVGALQGAMSGGLFGYGMQRALQPNPTTNYSLMPTPAGYGSPGLRVPGDASSYFYPG